MNPLNEFLAYKYLNVGQSEALWAAAIVMHLRALPPKLSLLHIKNPLIPRGVYGVFNNYATSNATARFNADFQWKFNTEFTMNVMYIR